MSEPIPHLTVNESLESLLNAAFSLMKEARQRTYSGPAATRVICALLILVASEHFSREQQEQVKTIIKLHDECLLKNGEVKN
ncbi:hypothetical protein EPA93_19120 [Ktedonosporobacter rubrisoli]|uniref:Uncharacterized protein n=1 Tax=Ktedonosporobacter rubrisoli TaxID=2509675 RepID=A0A4V0YZ00_KTERU|nr:hypothetical protein [Ktedonosporobacter rubrisoli]QBD77991.1 hypothetical protein EPA93_19120 [Ktedonosporobacter rubrisoli]